ncbi:MAG: porin, partial [Alphaproteobacteria bacterium]|nr:porin [Alphaproteobacteria bacterium]
MKRILLGTTALALAGATAAGQVSAADMLSVGVGGYMEQWVGFVDRSDSANPAVEGGIGQWSDSEIFFRGKLEADNGLTFSVKVELEGNTAGDTIDESQLTVSGSFGQIVLGTEDHPAALMHYGNQDVGVGYCGDSGW